MKRFHINLTVSNLAQSAAFYTELFGTEPTVRHHDYAKWMLDNPRVNFAITTRGVRPGVDHVGIQAETKDELAEIRTCLEAAGAPILDQEDVTCCYAQSKKAWISDPDGVAWETFLSHGETTIYGDGGEENRPRIADMAETANPCCDPQGEPSVSTT